MAKQYNLLRKVILPTLIGSKIVNLETEVVHNGIPLLIHFFSTKKAEAVLDFSNDTISLFGECHHLRFTTTGYYCIQTK